MKSRISVFALALVVVSLVKVPAIAESRADLSNQYFEDSYERSVSGLQSSNQTLSAEEFDDDKASRVGQKALFIHTGEVISDLLHTSELKGIYRYLVKKISEVHDSAKLSLQSGASGFDISNKTNGRKIFELDLEPSDKTLIAPYINVMEIGKIRYDLGHDTVMFEIRGKW